MFFGGLSAWAPQKGFKGFGFYDDAMEPYRKCGIILMPTSLGMGVQIKGIESLAAGRAIVARRGAMRGIPMGNGAWIEVDSAKEMRDVAMRLHEDTKARFSQMAAAKEYYRRHIDSICIQKDLVRAFSTLGHSA
jgi:glycosyltransferase involved in cell wall biosynthesis